MCPSVILCWCLSQCDDINLPLTVFPIDCASENGPVHNYQGLRLVMRLQCCSWLCVSHSCWFLWQFWCNDCQEDADFSLSLSLPCNFFFQKSEFKPFHVGCKILLRAFELLNASNKRHTHPLLQPGKVMPVSYSSFSPVLLFALLCDTLYRNLNWHTNQFFHRTTGGLIHQFKLWCLFFLQSEFTFKINFVRPGDVHWLARHQFIAKQAWISMIYDLRHEI